MLNKRQIASDVILWTLILGLVGGGAYELGYARPNSRKQVIKLYFKDANELTKGSMVRMMGTEVGYVDDIKIRNDHVDVTVKTFANALHVPSGSHFTIDFTGLVGSKSIEIIPPRIPRPTLNGKSQYFVVEPIRMKDTLKYQIDIAQALQRGAENFTDFFGKKESVEELQYNIRAGHHALESANRTLADVQSKIDTTRAQVAPGLHNAAETAHNFAQASDEAIAMTKPNSMGPYLSDLFRTIHLIFMEGRATIIGMQVEHKIGHFNEDHLVTVSKNMGQLRHSVQNAHLGWVFADLNTSITQLHELLSSAQWSLREENQQILRNFKIALEQFNAQLTKIYWKISGALPKSKK